jgi:hypothetical protein
MKDIKRVDTPFGRVYVIKSEDGIQIYPSVTTVLSSEPQPWLEQLSNNLGAEELSKISARAANRGTVMHTYLENYLICMGFHGKGDDCLLYAQKKTAKDIAGQFDEQTVSKGRDLFYNMLESELFVQMSKPLFSEKFLWSHTTKFAGTADFGYVDAEADGVIIGDFKSASSPRGDEQTSKYRKQLGAYSIAYEERTGQHVKRAEVWISHPEGIQSIILEGDELISAREDFKKLCENYHKNWNKKQIIDYLKSLKDSKMTAHGSEG